MSGETRIQPKPRPLPIQSFTERREDLPYLIVGLVALVATVLGIWIILEVL